MLRYYTDHEIATAAAELRRLEGMTRAELDALPCGDQDARGDLMDLIRNVILAPRHLTLDDLDLDPRFRPTATIRLRDGESIENPASTKRRLHGPALVKITRHADGGIDAKVEA